VNHETPMMNPLNVRILACNEAVYWVKEAHGILVVDERQGEVHRLFDLECTIWSWLSLGYSFSELTQFLVEMLDISMSEAQQRLGEILVTWVYAGLLEDEIHLLSQAGEKNRRSVVTGKACG
jgi:hypothetical protein